MQGRSPSLFGVISTDYPSFLSVLFPIVFGGFSLYFFFTGNDALRLFLPLTIGVAVVGVPVLVQRYGTISSVFTDGTPTSCVLTGISFFRGRGRIEYSYTLQGEKQVSGSAINNNSRTRKLSVGQTVTVLVDRDNPKRAFIRDIYR